MDGVNKSASSVFPPTANLLAVFVPRPPKLESQARTVDLIAQIGEVRRSALIRHQTTCGGHELVRFMDLIARQCIPGCIDLDVFGSS